MVKYNQRKFEELILFLSIRFAGDENFGSTRLAKALFWSDFEHFRETGDAITGVGYIKMRHGPVPNGFTDYLKSMAGKEPRLRLDELPSGDKTQIRPVALDAPNLELFTPRELATVERIIPEQWGRKATDVSLETHRFIGWQIARPHERIPYGTIWLSAPPPTKEECQRALALATRLGRV